MSLASWKSDPALTRPKHQWKYDETIEHSNGAISVAFQCENSGCKTRTFIPVNPQHLGGDGGICFDSDKAIQLTDRDGNPV